MPVLEGDHPRLRLGCPPDFLIVRLVRCCGFTSGVARQDQMFYPSPARSPRRVRCGEHLVPVGGGVMVRRPLYVYTTRVLSVGLALEFRSRVHNLVDDGAVAS